MGDRYWLWMGGRLLAGVIIVGWAASYLGTGSSEKEFQKTLDAMKQVHSFRAAYSANPNAQHNDMLWEVDCNRNILHYQMHVVETSNTPPTDMTREEMHVAGREYDRQGDGPWSKGQYGEGGNSAKRYCTDLAQGTDNYLFPQIATMIRRGILEKGDKKTVNGVRCRDWRVTLKGGPSGMEHDTVCIGLDDRLPYELTVDWQASRTSFSDYNAPISFDLPEAAVQPASATSSTN